MITISININTVTTHLRQYHQPSRGFTIVELLIVIVIIAVLAAITLVSYNGITTRAKNTSVINAASQSLRLIQAYISTTEQYPLTSTTSSSSCPTKSTVCRQETASSTIGINSTMTANIATVGTLPNEVPVVDSDKSGVMY